MEPLGEADPVHLEEARELASARRAKENEKTKCMLAGWFFIVLVIVTAVVVPLVVMNKNNNNNSATVEDVPTNNNGAQEAAASLSLLDHLPNHTLDVILVQEDDGEEEEESSLRPWPISGWSKTHICSTTRTTAFCNDLLWRRSIVPPMGQLGMLTPLTSETADLRLAPIV